LCFLKKIYLKIRGQKLDCGNIYVYSRTRIAFHFVFVLKT